MDFIRKVLPNTFDDILFVPSVGASGGLLIDQKSNLLIGTLKLTSGFAIAVEFTLALNDASWNLMNVYGPCTLEGKREFTTWLKIQISNRKRNGL